MNNRWYCHSASTELKTPRFIRTVSVISWRNFACVFVCDPMIMWPFINSSRSCISFKKYYFASAMDVIEGLPVLSLHFEQTSHLVITYPERQSIGLDSHHSPDPPTEQSPPVAKSLTRRLRTCRAMNRHATPASIHRH